MLYVIHCANHSELTYRGGEGPIVHLEADLHQVIRWADERRRRWAFSLSNAGAYYTEFRSRVTELDQIDWAAIAATDFRSAELKEGKQAEFLVHESLPWELVVRVGVRSADIKARAVASIGAAAHRPLVEIQPAWYYH